MIAAMGHDSDPTARRGSWALADTEARPSAPDELQPGTLLGDYVIERPQGRGGFGVVYRGKHADTGQPAALKVLHESLVSSPAILARFHREALALNEIGHPGIVQILAVGTSREGRPYIALEWLEGRDLHDELDAVGHFSLTDALGIMERLGPPLAAAHERGFVHRDLKPTNVMVLRDGGRLDLKLLDFGVAKLLGPESEGDQLTRTGEQVGTISSMAPEQILAQPVDARTDVYALGLMLFELLTGRPAFRGATPAELQDAHLRAPPPRVSELTPVSPAVDAVIARCLAKDRQERYAGVGSFLEALRRAAAPEAGAERQVPAVAIFVDARPGDDASDAELDALEAALERGRGALRAWGMSVVVDTQTSLLALSEVQGDDADARRQCVRRARELSALLQAEVACPLTVVAHAAAAQRDAGHAWVGGPLLELTRWTEGRPPSGIAVTRSLMRGVEAEVVDLGGDLLRLVG